MKRALLVLAVLLVSLATSVTVVQQDEVAGVRRWGAALAEPWGPGLRWGCAGGLARVEVADGMLRAVQEQADRQGLGVSVRAIRLGRVTPPVAVAPAFADAARARSDRRQAVTGAQEYRDRALADAQGQVRETADRASGRFDRDVQVA